MGSGPRSRSRRPPGGWELLHGRPEPPAAPRELRAGPLHVELDGIDLRHLRVGGVEVVRGVAAAVRDVAWGTPAAQVADLRVTARPRSFRVRFAARHERGELAFRWEGEIEGREDGTVVYGLEGAAERAFRYCRIGLNVLHPPADCAGAAYRADGGPAPGAGSLPERIGPQPFVDGEYLPLFAPFARLELEQRSGAVVRCAWEGALAETEDQRNWSDASYKTYAPPLVLGWPLAARPGERVAQRVRLALVRPPRRRMRRPAAPALRVGEETGATVPPIGLCAARDGEPPSARGAAMPVSAPSGSPLSRRERELLRALRPAHLRVDVALAAADVSAALDSAMRQARELGCELELALRLGGDDEAGLAELAAAALQGPAPSGLARVLVLDGDEVTTAASLARVRDALGERLRDVPLVGGTDHHFAELNRTPPTPGAFDAVAFPVSPQVHAFDERSIVETLEAQPELLRTARARCGELPLHVGPLTLLPRADGEGDAPPDAALPPDVDPRQMSLFAAAWTLASLAALAHAGAASVTCCETVGWRGVVESDGGSPAPGSFPSMPAMVFPLHDALAEACALRGATLLAVAGAGMADVHALAARTHDGATVALVANLRPQARSVTLEGIGADRAALRALDATAVAAAPCTAGRLRTGAEAVAVHDGRVVVPLAPYAIARVAWRRGPSVRDAAT